MEGDSSDGRLIAQRIAPLQDAATLGEFRHLTLTLACHLEQDTLLQVRDLLTQTPGTCGVMLALRFADGDKMNLRAANQFSVMPSMDLLARLEGLLGTDNVRVA